MLAAKAGMRPLAKAGAPSQALVKPRSIHIHASPGRPPPSLSTARTFLSRVVTLLRPQAAPTVIKPSPWRAARVPGFGQSLSLPVRHAMSRPMRPMFLGNPPAVPRGISDVGLGTARNFSTARPLFQNLVENVPITARSLCEADLDLKSRKSKRGVRFSKPNKDVHKKKVTSKRTPVLQNKAQNVAAAAVSENTESIASFTDSELVNYFFPNPVDATSTPLTTTYLHIALAPTPTNRMPLHNAHSSSGPRLLPYSLLAQIHVNHEARANALAELFRRLDAAHVWDRGAKPPEAYGDPSGLCTVLRVEFVGWSEAAVRAIVGDLASEWCTFEEIVHGPPAIPTLAPVLEESPVPERRMMEFQDPSTISFVMPTLDFSSSFLASHDSSPISDISPPHSAFASGTSTPISDFESRASTPTSAFVSGISTPAESEAWSDSDSDSDSMSLHSFSSSDDARSSSFESNLSGATGVSWLGFSSDFARRASEMSDFHTH